MQSNNNWRDEVESTKTQEIIQELDNIIGEDPNIQKTKNKIETLMVNNAWNDKNERLIASIGENAVSYKWLHEKSAMYYNSVHRILQLVIIVFSTGLSAQTFFPGETNEALDISKRVFIYITNVLTVTINYLKFTELANNHTAAANKFSELYHDIQQQLCMYRKDRYLATKYIQETFKKYDTLVVSSPDLSPYIISKFKDTFKNSNLSMPDITDRLQKIEIITENGTPNQNFELSNVNSGLTPNGNINTAISGNLKSINKINSLIIEGDITDEDLKMMNHEDINDLKTKGILAKLKWEDQRFSDFS